MWTIFGTIFLIIAEVAFGKVAIPFENDYNIPAIHPLSDQMIDQINQLQPLWKAGRNFNPNISMNYIRGLMGALEEPWYMRLPERKPHRLEGLLIPKEFDSRTKWTKCPSLNEIRDQGGCASCWAISAVETMTDRYCIASKGRKQFRFSADNLMNCCTFLICGMGCTGGYPPMAWRYFKRTGIVSGGPYNSHQGCQPYGMEPCEHHTKGPRVNCTENRIIIPSCHRKCEASYPVSYKDDLHYGSKIYSVPRHVEQIQTEIMAHGPVQAVFVIYDDFLSYKSGIYEYTTGSFVGGHAVKIIGWGEENGIPYWTIANSWNYDFGEKGFFKIRRGVNECGIEGRIQAGIPKVV